MDGLDALAEAALAEAPVGAHPVPSPLDAAAAGMDAASREVALAKGRKRKREQRVLDSVLFNLFRFLSMSVAAMAGLLIDANKPSGAEAAALFEVSA